MSRLKTIEIDGLDFYLPEGENSSLTYFQNEKFVEKINYKPTIFVLLLSLTFLATTAIFFWIFYLKYHLLYFLINGIILNIVFVFSFIPLIYFWQTQARMESLAFNETSHVKNKEMFCFIYILGMAIYVGALSFMNLEFSHFLMFQTTLTNTEFHKNFESLFIGNNTSYNKMLRFLSIPGLFAFFSMILGLFNIVSNIQIKFTLNLMSLNITLLVSFISTFFGIIQYYFLNAMIREGHEPWNDRLYKVFIYLFLFMIVVLFANCVQAVIKRKGILVGFGLGLFVIALVGLIFTGMFFRGFRDHLDSYKTHKYENFTTSFQKSTVETYCKKSLLDLPSLIVIDEACIEKLLIEFLNKCFILGFSAIISFIFMFAGAIFNFELSKEEQDQPTNFIIFTFVFVMIAIMLGVFGFFLKLFFS